MALLSPKSQEINDELITLRSNAENLTQCLNALLKRIEELDKLRGSDAEEKESEEEKAEDHDYSQKSPLNGTHLEDSTTNVR